MEKARGYKFILSQEQRPQEEQLDQQWKRASPFTPLTITHLLRTENGEIYPLNN